MFQVKQRCLMHECEMTVMVDCLDVRVYLQLCGEEAALQLILPQIAAMTSRRRREMTEECS